MRLNIPVLMVNIDMKVIKKHLDDKTKQEIVEYKKTHTKTETATYFNIAVSTVEYWCSSKNRDKRKIRTKEEWNENKKDPNFLKENNEKFSLYRKEYWAATKEAYWPKRKAYLENNPDKLAARQEYNHKRYLNDRERICAYVKQRRLDNLDLFKEESKERYENEKMSGSLKKRRQLPHNKLKKSIRDGLDRALDLGILTKKSMTFQYLGCSLPEFKKHIESLFKPGMTWENRGRTHILGERAWHLDHKLPLVLLAKNSSQEMIQKLCHYTNIQPLWEDENLTKLDSYEEEDLNRILNEINIQYFNYIPQITTISPLL